MASVSPLVPRHCFGLRADVPRNVLWAEEQTLAFPAGHNVVLHSLEHRSQRFITCNADAPRITALAFCAALKYVAVAEAAAATGADASAQIALHDVATLKRRKLLASSDVGSAEVVDMCFSADGRVLLTQGGGPDWNLVIWAWEKSKVVHVARMATGGGAALQCLLCPRDQSLVTVLSAGSLKVLRITEGGAKAGPQPMPKRESQEYRCHCWTADSEAARLLVGCASGEILLLESLDLKSVLHTDDGAPCECLAAFEKGFVAGQGNGALAVFERDDGDSYRRTKVFALAVPQRLRALAFSFNEALLAVTTEGGQIYTIALGNMQILKTDDDNFEPLSGMRLPSADVTGIDVCIRKPLAATCSLDKHVRIWNWQDTTLEIAKGFQDEAHSIALHPNGLLLLVGFTDKLRLFAILMDDLKLYRELSVKQCREVRFSHGGQFFAAANGPLVQVYSSYTCEVVSTLRGHNGKVTAIYWHRDDARITTAGRDGAVYEWRIADSKRLREHVLKGCQYSAVCHTPDNALMLVSGSDKKLKQLEEHEQSGTQVCAEHALQAELTQMYLANNGKLLFASSVTGCLMAYKWPMTGECSLARYHSGAVTCMRMLHDESLLFTAGVDGSVIVFDVRMDVKGARRDGDMLPFADEVLVTHADLEERKARFTELETKYNQQLRQNQMTIHIKDLETREKIKELTDKFAVESENERQRYELLQQQKVEAELEFSDQIASEEEKRQQQLEALDSQYQTKLMAEVERYQALVSEKEVLNSKWDEQNATLVEAHERVVQEITEEFEAKVVEEQVARRQLQQIKDDLEREFHEVKGQLEEDTDREIEVLKARYEGKLEIEKKLAVQLKGENGLMRKRFNGLEKAIDEQKAEIRQLNEAQDRLYMQIALHEKDILAFKEEVRERDRTISEKEKRIYDLKKKNQELEKFKFVLDHKIKELKKQVEPKDEAIADMKDQIKEMDQELTRYHKTNERLELDVSDAKLKQQALHKEVLAQRGVLSDNEGLIKHYQHDLHDIAQSVQDPRNLKAKVKAMYGRHITSPVAVEEMDNALHIENQRQRDYLEKTVQSLKTKLEKDTATHRADNLRVMQENVTLIKEINELRREIRLMRALSAGGAGQEPAGAKKGVQELDAQTDLVDKLRAEIAARDERIAQLESHIMPRPVSRERLPPMDGFEGTHPVAAPS